MTHGLPPRKPRPITTHTVASLHARCDDEGACWLWTGYAQSGSPYVCHAGKMIAVRKLMLQLTGKKLRQADRYFATRCGNTDCIHPDCIVPRTEAEHMAAMAANVRHQHPVRVAKLQAAARARPVCKLTEAKAQAIPAPTHGPAPPLPPTWASANPWPPKSGG